MPTIDELQNLFGLSSIDKTAAVREDARQLLDGVDKTAHRTDQGAETMSTTLRDLLNETNQLQKTAAQRAHRTELEKTAEELARADIAFEKIAGAFGTTKQTIEKIAVALNGVPLTKEARDQIALEFDAGGRFMARGFHDESIKLAAAWETHVKRAMGDMAPGQIENDLNSAHVPIPTTGPTPKAENANISAGAATTTEAGKQTEVDTRLPGGSLGQSFTVRDALGLPAVEGGAAAPA